MNTGPGDTTPQSDPASSDDDAGLAGALMRYRIMAYVVGVGLILLVLVGMPLKYGAGVDAVVKIVGPLHGFLYIVYLLAALDLARRARLSFWYLLSMVAAGLVPFVAFIVERRITASLSPQPAQSNPA